MTRHALLAQLATQTEALKDEGLYKPERVITSSQGAEIAVGDQRVMNFCANNYLGLANHPDLIRAAQQGLDEHGFGMASVRFICPVCQPQSIHLMYELT